MPTNRFANQSIDSLLWLQQWFASHCNGEWEHEAGISLNTLDNPLWSLKIEVTGTYLENYPSFHHEEGEWGNDNWLECHLENGLFQASCGTSRLTDMIAFFRKCATEKP